MAEDRKGIIKIKETMSRGGWIYFFMGLGLILAYYCVNHVAVLNKGLDRINEILFPFYLGIAVAYVMCPIYNGVVRLVYEFHKEKGRNSLKRFKIAKVISTITVILLILIIICGFIMMIGPDLWQSVTTLIGSLPDFTEKLGRLLGEKLENNQQLAVLLEGKVTNYSERIIQWAETKMVPGASLILTGVIGTLETTVNIVVALIICMYILNTKEIFMAQTKKLVLAFFSDQKAERVFEFGRICNQTFGGYINGKIIDSVLVGIICFIAMTILNIPLAVLISVVVGISNMIPFFGPIIGGVPSALILLMFDPIGALKFSIMILILQQIDGNVIEPKILGKNTKIASFWVLFSIILGGGLFGVLGMILGVPVFAVMYFYVSRNVKTRLREKELPADRLTYLDYQKYNIDKEELFGKKKKDGDEKSNKNRGDDQRIRVEEEIS